tara:strand:+ start:46 stop:1083 length:1038 start_codon:yes stop_codon:yes gene_type:complete
MVKKKTTKPGPKTKKQKAKAKKIEPWDITIYDMKTLSGILNTLDQFRDKYKSLTKRELYKYFPEMIQLDCIYEELKVLNEMIGMQDIKQQIIDQLLLNIQEMTDIEMLHTVIFGPPGVGKTCIAHIMASIYSSLGWLSVGNVYAPKRNDLVGRYLGETADKTQKYLEACKGSVCFIDEVYSLGGNDDGKDSFAKEAVDTLNQFLSEEAHDFVCIIAGYEDSVKKCFFNQNAGLDRRFPWKFTINKYNSKELEKIFRLQVTNKNWKLEEGLSLQEYFKDVKYFTGNGGDTMNLFGRCIIAHSTRVFGQSHDVKKILTKKDMQEGYKNYVKIKQPTKVDLPPSNMYI